MDKLDSSDVKGKVEVGRESESEMVFIPTNAVDSIKGRAELQLREMKDGRMAVLVYTSLDLLVAGCGAQQPWIASPVDELESLQPLAGFDVIAVNVGLPDGWRVAAGGSGIEAEDSGI